MIKLSNMLLRFLCLFILNAFTFTSIKADGGTCIKFEVEITLQNDSIVRGFYFSPYYDLPLDSQTVNRIVDKRISPYYLDFNDSIEIYTSIIELLDSDIIGSMISAYQVDRIRISFGDIKSVNQIKREGCGFDDQDDWEFNGSGIYPYVFTEFTDDEIDKIRDSKPSLFFYFDKCECWGLSMIYVISYNLDLSKVEIINLMDDRICKQKPSNTLNLNTDNCRSEYKNLKKELKSKNIILFKAHYEN